MERRVELGVGEQLDVGELGEYRAGVSTAEDMDDVVRQRGKMAQLGEGERGRTMGEGFGAWRHVLQRGDGVTVEECCGHLG